MEQLLSYSPDGSRIVGGSTDGTVRVWDAHSGQQLLSLSGHTAAVIGVRYSPDGSRIVSSGSDDKTVRVWDAHSGQQLLLIKQENEVYGVCYSPDGLRIVSGSADKTGREWDADNIGEFLWLTGHKAWVQGVSCSSDGARILSASGGDRTVRVWDASSGQQLRCFTAPNGSIDYVSYSSDESSIILGYSGSRIYVRDADSGQCPDAHWHDAAALEPIKAEAKRFPWCLVTGAPWQESAIETADTALAIAWFATCLVRHVTPASERTWGGVPYRSRHLYLITLEGAPPNTPDIAW